MRASETYARLAVNIAPTDELSVGSKLTLTVTAVVKATVATGAYKLFVVLPPGLIADNKPVSKKAVDGYEEIAATADWNGVASVDKPQSTDSNKTVFATWTVGGSPQNPLNLKGDASNERTLSWTVPLTTKPGEDFSGPKQNQEIGSWLWVTDAEIPQAPAVEVHKSVKVTVVSPELVAVTPVKPAVGTAYQDSNKAWWLPAVTQLNISGELQTAVNATTLFFRWRKKGAGSWQRTPDTVDVSGKTVGPVLLPGIELGSATPSVELEFSVAEQPASSGDVGWSAKPFSLKLQADTTPPVLASRAVTFAAGKLQVTGAATDEQSGPQSCEFSTDGGTHWVALTGTESGNTYTGIHEFMGPTDFSQGVYVRATDHVGNVSPPTVAPIDAAPLIDAEWMATDLDPDLAQQWGYWTNVLLKRAQLTLPPMDLKFTLPDGIVRDATAPGEILGSGGDVTACYSISPEWTGKGMDSQMARLIPGDLPLSIHARVTIEDRPGLVGQAVGAATLGLASPFFRAEVLLPEPSGLHHGKFYEPAPAFDLDQNTLLTHSEDVTVRGVFGRSPAPGETVVFEFKVGNGQWQQVAAQSVNIHGNNFVVQLPALDFAAEQLYKVRLQAHYKGDSRPEYRSRFSTDLVIVINNAAPRFDAVVLNADVTALHAVGKVFGPATHMADNPVVAVQMLWDGIPAQARPATALTPANKDPAQNLQNEWNFTVDTPIADFNGLLAPILKATTRAQQSVERPYIFPTAEGLIKVEFKVNNDLVPGTTAQVTVDTSFVLEVTVTPLVGIHRFNVDAKLDEQLDYDPDTDPVVLVSPQSGKGTVRLLLAWDGTVSTQVAAAEELIKGSSFQLKFRLTLTEKASKKILFELSDPEESGSRERTAFQNKTLFSLTFNPA